MLNERSMHNRKINLFAGQKFCLEHVLIHSVFLEIQLGVCLHRYVIWWPVYVLPEGRCYSNSVILTYRVIKQCCEMRPERKFLCWKLILQVFKSYGTYEYMWICSRVVCSQMIQYSIQRANNCQHLKTVVYCMHQSNHFVEGDVKVTGCVCSDVATFGGIWYWYSALKFLGDIFRTRLINLEPLLF
jgi:hypothetical protein